MLSNSPTWLNGFSYALMLLGVVFWFWGTLPLLGHRSVLYKLHSLSVSDTLGSMAIVLGLLLKIPQEWPLLVLALISLGIWNTVLGYVLAYCSSENTTHDPDQPAQRLGQATPEDHPWQW
ncbi:monovalent cation/H(+) antiporter subunit G [Leptolyngbya sp. PCC 6406]|uniref:monovalent cation/H(+) antiporter subunit G n=1 Tax=Leptolyngbya sp. PCC 6406 TaxID=1173264 RepID=UPI0002ABC824|nr:monovalent cation/H(+) antiporter subunit G [Leptolyngbya sp. PCC 6406]